VLWKLIFENFTKIFMGIDMEKTFEISKKFEKEKRNLKKYGEY
jgi:hypothetical protein